MEREKINQTIKHELDFRITNNMTGFSGDIKPSAVLDIFQTVAESHVEKLGLSVDFLLSEGYAWVLQSVKYEKVGCVKSGQIVKAVTYPLKPRGVFYDREYFLSDENGNTLVKGSSRWVIINLSSRKIELGRRFSYPSEIFVQDGVFENRTEVGRLRPNRENMSFVGELLIGKSMIDRLSHMNNTRYADVVCEFFPFDFKSLAVEYVKEIREGETVSVYAAQTPCGAILTGEVESERRFVARFEL